MVRRLRVRLTYEGVHEGRSRERTERVVDPGGLVDKDHVWCLVADTDRGRRTFRVDRIVTAEITGDRAERPDRFALQEAWQEVVGEVQRRRSPRGRPC